MRLANILFCLDQKRSNSMHTQHTHTRRLLARKNVSTAAVVWQHHDVHLFVCPAHSVYNSILSKILYKTKATQKIVRFHASKYTHKHIHRKISIIVFVLFWFGLPFNTRQSICSVGNLHTPLFKCRLTILRKMNSAFHDGEINCRFVQISSLPFIFS